MPRWDRERRPARRASEVSPRKRLLVVCEGEVTEPEYLESFKKACRNGVDLIVTRIRAGICGELAC